MAGWFEQGGAAFPVPHSGAPGQPEAEYGMSLLEWYAGQALPALLERAIIHVEEAGPPMEGYAAVRASIAKECFDIAEAMIAERDRRLAGKPEGSHNG